MSGCLDSNPGVFGWSSVSSSIGLWHPGPDGVQSHPSLMILLLFFHMLNTPRWCSISVLNIHTIPQHRDACQDSLWHTHTHTLKPRERNMVCEQLAPHLTFLTMHFLFMDLFFLNWHGLPDIKCKADVVVFFTVISKIACFLINMEDWERQKWKK